MAVAQEFVGRGGVLIIEVTGAASTGNAGIGAFANPEGAPLLILRATWHVLTPSTGAANISIGVAADDESAATDIINALAVNGAITGKVYNGHAMQNTAKTEITAPVIWTAAKYITFTGSGSTVDLDARLYVEYVRLAE